MADTNSRAGTRYATADVLAYLAKLHTPHDAGLDLAFTAPEREGIPSIQVGPADGKMLAMLLGLVSAKRVVEVGTLAGYSTIWMARALAPGGHLWTVEYDPRHAKIAEANLEAAGVADRVTVCVGAGNDVLPTLAHHGPFDAVFVDADKGNYDSYGRWAAANLREDGLLLGDNAFYFGRLLDESPEALAMRTFHEEAALAFDTVCIPTADGLLLGRKRGA